MALASLPIPLLFDESYAIVPFLLLAVLSLLLGQALFRYFHEAESMRLPHAMITAALGWAVIPLLGAIPIFLIANRLAADPLVSETVLAFQYPLNALFEAFSGYTSTGLTVALRPSELPRSLQWWRSFMEWVGGVGVIVLMLAVLMPSDPRYLFYAEARERRIWPSISNSVRAIWWIYLAYTAVSIVALRLVGLDWWAAINHGLTGISTGGFTITDNSIGAYPPQVQIVVILIMTVGAISFAAHHELLRERNFHTFWEEIQPRALLFLLVVGTLLLYFEIGRGESADEPRWLASLFQWVSALGTCGFSTADLGQWNTAAQLLLSGAMIIGGAAGSTAGGLKLLRVVTLVKGLYWRFRRLISQPQEVLTYHLGDEYLTELEASRRVESAGVLAITWVTLIGIGTLILLHIVPDTYSLSEVIFETSSALGSVGLSTGITHPALAWPGKVVLILFMWMGRLEIIPVLLLFASLLSVPSRYLPRRLPG
ncbi:MAG: TrkH family potassium uptake protein [Chloroflexota bacterium]|nr:TrkH family potassium uptake protein [Chloroflexota bacterium]